MNRMFTSIDAEKAFDQVPHHDKKLQQSRVRGNIPQHNKGHI